MRLKLYRGYWYAVWSEAGGTKRRALRTKDRDTAAQRLADLTAAPAHTPAGSTVTAIMQAYIAASAGKSSQDRMKYALMRISPDLGHLRPYQITAQQCEAYAERRRRQGGGDGTIRRELGIMRAALRAADKHTPAVVKMPESPAPRDRHLTRKEFGRLLAAARSPHIRLFIILALSTGGRAGAILELTWDRIDIQRGRIMLAKEGQRGRKGRATVPMTNSAREALQGAQHGLDAITARDRGGRLAERQNGNGQGKGRDDGGRDATHGDHSFSRQTRRRSLSWATSAR